MEVPSPVGPDFDRTTPADIRFKPLAHMLQQAVAEPRRPRFGSTAPVDFRLCKTVMPLSGDITISNVPTSLQTTVILAFARGPRNA